MVIRAKPPSEPFVGQARTLFLGMNNAIEDNFLSISLIETKYLLF